MKIADLRAKNSTQLQQELTGLREQMRALRFKTSQNQLKSVRELRQVRKNIARILTVSSAQKSSNASSSTK